MLNKWKYDLTPLDFCLLECHSIRNSKNQNHNNKIHVPKCVRHFEWNRSPLTHTAFFVYSFFNSILSLSFTSIESFFLFFGEEKKIKPFALVACFITHSSHTTTTAKKNTWWKATNDNLKTKHILIHTFAHTQYKSTQYLLYHLMSKQISR